MLPNVFIIEIISNRPVKRRSGPRIIWFLFLTLTQTWIINSIATFMIKLWNKRGVSNFFPHLEKCNQYNFYSNKNNNNKYSGICLLHTRCPKSTGKPWYVLNRLGYQNYYTYTKQTSSNIFYGRVGAATWSQQGCSKSLECDQHKSIINAD